MNISSKWLVLLAIVALPASAETLNIDTSGYGSYGVTGDVNLDTSGGGLDVNATNYYTGAEGSVQLDSGNIKSQYGGSQLDLNLQDGGLNLNAVGPGASGSINLQEAVNGGLNVSITNNSLDAGTKSLILNLQEGSEASIKTEADLNAYNNLVIQSRPGIRGIEIASDNGAVIVKYNQPARFLGIFGGNLGATVTVDEEGKVEVKLPWYSFLFRKNTASVKSNIEAKVSLGGSNSNRLRRNAQVVNAVTSTVSSGSNTSSNTQGNVNTNTNVNTSNSTDNPFAGVWKGSIAAISVSAQLGCFSGSVSFTVDKTGKLSGSIGTNVGSFGGGGSVDMNGNMTAAWSASGEKINLNGKLSGNSGSGTYEATGSGCRGNFSVTRQ